MEFKIKDGKIIALNLLKKEINDDRTLFDLIDENQEVWMKLEICNNSLSISMKSDDIIDDDDIIESKMDDLLSEIIEIEKSGTDNYNEGNSIELNPYNPEEIKVRSDKIPITLISQMIDNKDIDLNPDFQRHLVWDHIQKSRLIESVLLRIPLPMFYFAEDKEGKLSVVDGLQRISTIKEFMNNKFPLKNLQYLETTCGGKYYETKDKKQGIDAKYFRWFNLTTLSANIIDPSSPFEVKYDIFRRINTGGKPLNNQEIRNCLTGQGLRETLKEMASLEEFKTATDNSIKPKRMEDQEVVLRFLMFYDMVIHKGDIDSYNGYMDSSLDEFTEIQIKSKKSDFEQQIKNFSNAMKNAEYLIGRKYAFRKIAPDNILPGVGKQLINKALFVCISILLADWEHEKIKFLNANQALLSPLATKIRDDRQLFNYLSYGTNGKANLLYTYKILKQLFNEIIKY
ncbi:MAG: DUF262 domain-containing protein [Prevotellaceae bacterium]|nr:DUF262 domain-containing protein [Prevotellaceae bacterium]